MKKYVIETQSGQTRPIKAENIKDALEKAVAGFACSIEDIKHIHQFEGEHV